MNSEDIGQVVDHLSGLYIDEALTTKARFPVEQGCLPDYALVVVASNNGVLRMMKEHLAVAVALNLPLVFAVTKIDLCPPNILKQTLSDIGRLLKSSALNKMPVIVRTNADVLLAARSMSGDVRIAPIFLLSSVTGAGMDLLRLFLNVAPLRKDGSKVTGGWEMHGFVRQY
mmetsp:Transcript_39030/g.103162  ORF Transcript_39030/g.103162 Transcript_39030/m.103162 type:complete len:171 (+) Transcript_39030:210-722(+)